MYDEGKTLLDQADRLMAIVHAARAEARENDAGIHKLIKMATHLIDQIEGHFNTVRKDRVELIVGFYVVLMV